MKPVIYCWPNHQLPKAGGALILDDEVKVISSLMRRKHHIIGLAMSSEHQSTLHDVFQLFVSDHHTNQHIAIFVERYNNHHLTLLPILYKP